MVAAGFPSARGHTMDGNVDGGNADANIAGIGERSPGTGAATGPHRLATPGGESSVRVSVNPELSGTVSRLFDSLDRIQPVAEGESARYTFNGLGKFEAEILSMLNGVGPSGTSGATDPGDGDGTGSLISLLDILGGDEGGAKGRAGPFETMFTGKGKGPAPNWQHGNIIGEAGPQANSTLPRMGFFPGAKGKSNSMANPHTGQGTATVPPSADIYHPQHTIFPTIRVPTTPVSLDNFFDQDHLSLDNSDQEASMDNLDQDDCISDILDRFPVPPNCKPDIFMRKMEHSKLTKQSKDPKNSAAKSAAAEHADSEPSKTPHLRSTNDMSLSEKHRKNIHAEHQDAIMSSKQDARDAKKIIGNNGPVKAAFKPLMTNGGTLKAPEEAPEEATKAAPSLAGPSKPHPTKRGQAAIKALETGCHGKQKFEENIETIIQGYMKTAKAGGSGREYLEAEVHTYIANRDGKSKQVLKEATNEQNSAATAAETDEADETEGEADDTETEFCAKKAGDEEAAAASTGNVGPFKPKACKGKYPAGLVEPFNPKSLESNVEPTTGGASTADDNADGPAVDADSLPAPKKTRKRKGHRGSGKKRGAAASLPLEFCTAPEDAFSPTPLTDLLLRSRMAVYKDLSDRADSNRPRDPSMMLDYLKLLQAQKKKDDEDKGNGGACGGACGA